MDISLKLYIQSLIHITHPSHLSDATPASSLKASGTSIWGPILGPILDFDVLKSNFLKLLKINFKQNF